MTATRKSCTERCWDGLSLVAPDAGCSRTLLLLSPFRPASFLSGTDTSNRRARHLAFRSATDGHNLRSSGFGPSCTLSNSNSGTTGGGDSASMRCALRVQRRECVVETFKLRSETDAFPLQLIEHGGEIRHGWELY